MDVASRIASVEIEPGDAGFYLLYIDANGACLTDTWHETAELAKRQARHEFAIEDEDWQSVDGG